MTASVYDSAILRDLFRDPDVAALFTDTAELRAMLLVWGALAQAQAAHGLIPAPSARAIQTAALEIQIDPAALTAETGQSGVVVPALVAAFRAEMKAPGHARWLHYGATSQDIMDTGLALRLRQVLALVGDSLGALVGGLGRLAAAQADTPMAGRTWGQIAVPTTFGAIVAGWGWPLLALRDGLGEVRAQVLRVSLSGAAGTLSTMGDAGPAVRAGLAAGLGLADPGRSWHADRQGIAALAAWMTQVTAQLARMGEDLAILTQSGIDEVRLPATGGSSTMPQKRNPVGPALLCAIARHVAGLNTVVQGAAVHRQQRDGAAWMAEWMCLPQMCLGLARALDVGCDLAAGILPLPDAMARNAGAGGDLIHAEALSFALARTLPRPDAQAAVKALCARVPDDGSLPDLARTAWPDADLDAVFDLRCQTGQAPAEARAFAALAGLAGGT